MLLLLVALLPLLTNAAPLPAKRSYPTRLNCSDTLMARWDPFTGEAVDVVSIHHGKVPLELDFIGDAEILQYHAPTQAEMRLDYVSHEEVYRVRVQYTDSGASIVQQQGIRACTAAASAMLIIDAGGEINVKAMHYRNLSRDISMAYDIRDAGFESIVTVLSEGDAKLRQLAKLVEQHGPAAIGVGGELGGHAIVVDAIDFENKTARIRDPHHGWQVTVTLEALEARTDLGSTTVVQLLRGSKKPAEAPTRWQRLKRALGFGK